MSRCSATINFWDGRTGAVKRPGAGKSSEGPRDHCDTGSRRARGKNKSFQFSRLQLESALQEPLVPRQFAVFAVVMQRHVGISSLVAQIDFASVERFGIHVDADRALVVLP